MNVRDTLAQWSARRDRITVKLDYAAMIYRMVTWGVTLPDGSHPICLGLRLFPGAHTTVGEVVITMSDGTLNVIFAFLNGS